MKAIHTMAAIGDSIQWGQLTGPVTRILIDDSGTVFYEFEHFGTRHTEHKRLFGMLPPRRESIGGMVRTWVRESECQTHHAH